MIRVNKEYSVQYKNGYYILRTHGVAKKGVESIKSDKTYSTLEAMILQSDFEMSYAYTDAALKSKADCEAEWNEQYLKDKKKKELINEKAQEK